jgi:hypothetical protein
MKGRAFQPIARVMRRWCLVGAITTLFLSMGSMAVFAAPYPVGAYDLQRQAMSTLPRDVQHWLQQNYQRIPVGVDNNRPPVTLFNMLGDAGGSSTSDFSDANYYMVPYSYTGSIPSAVFRSAPPAVRDWLTRNTPRLVPGGVMPRESYIDDPAYSAVFSIVGLDRDAAQTRQRIAGYNERLADLESRNYRGTDEYDRVLAERRQAEERLEAIAEGRSNVYAMQARYRGQLPSVIERLERLLRGSQEALDVARRSQVRRLIDEVNASSGQDDDEFSERLAGLMEELRTLELRMPPPNPTPQSIMLNGGQFSSLAFEAIYQRSSVYQTATFGPSSAGLSGYDAVPWISRYGLGPGASLAPNGLSSIAPLDYIDPRWPSGLMYQASLLQTQGRWEQARALLAAHAPAQLGGMIGIDAQRQYYLNLISAFVGGDRARLNSVLYTQAIIDNLAAQLRLTPEQVREQLRLLDPSNVLRGNVFLVTQSGVLVGIGGNGLIRGQLVWALTNDLDLHMLPPGATIGSPLEVAFFRRNVTFNGGGALAQLDKDNLGGQIDAPPNLRVENIVVTGTAIPAGAFQFFVVNYSANGNASTPFTLTLTGNGGATVQTITGNLQTTGQQSPIYTVTSPGGSF